MKKLFCLAVLLLAAQAALADLFFQPQSSAINVGDPITVDVMYSGAVSPWLGAYDIDISWDPAILQIAAVAWPDDFLGSSNLRDAVFNVPGGSVNVSEVSLVSVADLGAAQSGNDPFRLFELLFYGALAPGVSSLTFDRVELADGNGNALNAGSIVNGSVTVGGGAAVPEPATLWLLLGPALSGLAILRRRRQA